MKQRKPWITTLVLVGILAALAAYVFLVEAKREPPPEPEAQPTPAPLLEIEGNAVIELTITRGEQTTAVERGGEGWRMTEPEETEADGAQMSRLVSQVASMTYSRAMADVGDLSPFGLKEPEVQATLVLSDGTTINLAIGTQNPRKSARYVQKAGDPLVYVVSTSGLHELINLADDPPYPPTLAPTPTATPTS